MVGLLKCGAVFDLVSPPVLVGFVSASAITIATGQLKDLMGLPHIGREFVEAVQGLGRNIHRVNWWDLGLGLLCMSALMFMERLLVRVNTRARCATLALAHVPTRTSVLHHRCTALPQKRKGKTNTVVYLLGTARNAVVVIGGALLVFVVSRIFGTDTITQKYPFTLVGSLPSGLPVPRPPLLDTSLLGPAFVLAVVGFLESFGIASGFARKNRCGGCLLFARNTAPS